MADKKAVKLSKLTFGELKDKGKAIENFKALNRFELTQAVSQAESKADPTTGKTNPRELKPEIAALKAKLAETSKEDQKARRELRRAVSKLKRTSREYLR